MRNKEEILADRIVTFPSDEEMNDEDIKHNVHAAMDEYAKEQSIAFIKWAIDEALQGGHYGEVEFSVPKGPENAEQAYAQFLQSQSTNH